METLEKIGALTAKADAAHSRIDKLEFMIKDDLKEMKNDLKELTAHMNQGKGWAAAAMFAAGLLGGGAAKLLSLVIK